MCPFNFNDFFLIFFLVPQIKLLTQEQIDQKINRIAYHIYEDHCEEKEIIIAGIMDRGYVLAELIAKKLHYIRTL